MRRKNSIAGASIEEVRSRFEQWRQNRQGKSPIPDELWAAAAEAARTNGVSRTAAELRLDGGKLKRRMLASGASTGKAMSAAFVELMAPQSAGLPECTIELEGRRGKVRICWKGATAAELTGLSRALWDMAS